MEFVNNLLIGLSAGLLAVPWEKDRTRPRSHTVRGGSRAWPEAQPSC
jgi:hypothetical protein